MPAQRYFQRTFYWLLICSKSDIILVRTTYQFKRYLVFMRMRVISIWAGELFCNGLFKRVSRNRPRTTVVLLSIHHCRQCFWQQIA